MKISEAITNLETIIEWLDNMERKFGRVPVLDQMPNNFGGRFSILDVIELLRVIGNLRVVTLSDHAEAWQKERGGIIPSRSSPEWEQMYVEWIAYAFEGIGELEQGDTKDE